MTDKVYPGRVGLQQRVIPSYRVAFLDTLAQACKGGLGIFAGNPTRGEGIDPVDELEYATYTHTLNRSFGNPASPLFLCWQTGFIQWLEGWQPDILIVEANPRYLSTRRAIAWMRQRKRKVMGWGLGAPPISGPFAFIRRWERSSFLRSVDAVIAYSQVGAQQYRQFGFVPDRVYVASNAISPAPCSLPPVRTAEFDQKPTVLFVGRLQARKRLDLLLRACSNLPKDIQPRLVIVGDGPARSELQSLAFQLYPQAEFIGARHGREAEPYFKAADLFVLPGTGGLAIQQAMAFALPVIVARGDGTQDDLVRSENGWQIPADDLPALTAALRMALADAKKLRQMGAASFRIVSEEINVQKMVQAFVTALNDLSQVRA